MLQRSVPAKNRDVRVALNRHLHRFGRSLNLGKGGRENAPLSWTLALYRGPEAG